MVEQIATEHTKKLLIEGNGGVSRNVPPSQARRKPGRADVIVENATEKRYLWTARAFAIIFAVSICCNIMLLYVMIAINPLYRVAPYLFTFSSKEEQVYTILPVKDLYNKKYLTELFVREYVLLYNIFVSDIDEMEARWGPNGKVREMSSSEVYTKFKTRIKEPIMKMIRQYSITRDVKIASVTEVGGEGAPWWQVEYRVEDMAPSYETPRVSVWVANIKIQYRSKRVRFGERLNNPLGFTVIDYKQEERVVN